MGGTVLPVSQEKEVRLKDPAGLGDGGGGEGMKHRPPQDPATPLKELKIKPAGSGFTWDHLGLGTRLPHYLAVSPSLEAFLHHPPYPAPNFKVRQRVPRESVASVSSPAGLAPSRSPSLDEAPTASSALGILTWGWEKGCRARPETVCAPGEQSVNLCTSCRSGPGSRGSGGNPAGPRAASHSYLSPARPWHSAVAALGSGGESIGLSWSVAQPACELRLRVSSLAPHWGGCGES